MDRLLQQYSSFTYFLATLTFRCLAALITLQQCLELPEECNSRKAFWIVTAPLTSYLCVWIILRALQAIRQAGSLTLVMLVLFGALHSFVPDLIAQIMGKILAVIFIFILNLIEHLELLGQTILMIAVLDAVYYMKMPRTIKVPIVTLALLFLILIPYQCGMTMFNNDITKSGLAEQSMEEALISYEGSTKRDETYNSTFVFAFEMASRNETFARQYAYRALQDLVVPQRPNLADVCGTITAHYLHVDLGHLLSNASGLALTGITLEHIHSRHFLCLSVSLATVLAMMVDLIVPFAISPRCTNNTLLWFRWSAIFHCGFSGILNHLLALTMLDSKTPSLMRWWAYNIAFAGTVRLVRPGHIVGLITGVLQYVLQHRPHYKKTARVGRI